MADLRFANHDTTIQTNLKESFRTVLTKESTALFPVFHQTAVVTLRVPLALLDTVRGFLPTSGKEVLHEG